MWWHLLSPGCMLLGDDFSLSWPGVMRAACEHAMRYGKKLFRTGKKWWVFKGPQLHIEAGETFNAAKLSLCIQSPAKVADFNPGTKQRRALLNISTAVLEPRPKKEKPAGERRSHFGRR